MTLLSSLASYKKNINLKGLKVHDIVRIFKLESSKKGSEINFQDFELLLFKIGKIFFKSIELSPQEKYFKLVEYIIDLDNEREILDERNQIRCYSRKNRQQGYRECDRISYLPKIVKRFYFINIFFISIITKLNE